MQTSTSVRSSFQKKSDKDHLSNTPRMEDSDRREGSNDQRKQVTLDKIFPLMQQIQQDSERNKSDFQELKDTVGKTEQRVLKQRFIMSRRIL